MSSRLGAALFWLVIAIPFCGAGAGASWVLWRMTDGHRAGEWVRVKAVVDSHKADSISYHYRFRGVDYAGDRLGASPFGGAGDIDSWHDEIGARIAAARDGRKPLTVWVNPDNPAESMVDREIRWNLAAFFVPFAFGFGSVGLAMLWMFFRTLGTPVAKVQAQPHLQGDADAPSGLGTQWFFAFVWNTMAFPFAFIIVPQGIAEGRWLALAVLLFPLIGVFLIGVAFAATWKSIREKAASSPASDDGLQIK